MSNSKTNPGLSTWLRFNRSGKTSRSIVPYLVTNDVHKAIEFYKILFGAKELFRLEHNNIIHHAELLINDAVFMIGQPTEKSLLHENTNTNTNTNTNLTMGLYAPNVDETVKKAAQLGAIIEHQPENQFYGDRMASVIDPFCVKWGIATTVEKLSNEEIENRFNQMISNDKSADSELANHYKMKCIKYKIKYEKLRNLLSQQ